MSKANLKAAFGRILSDHTLSLSQAGEAMLKALQENGDAVSDLTASYRVIAKDTGLSFAFRVTAGLAKALPEDAPADVTVTGKEQHLTALLRGEIQPLPAVLTGKIKVKGDMAKLTRFAEFL